MADTIVRLKVDSKEYDNQLKKASQGLAQLEKSLKAEGKTLADVDKEQLKYIQAIGQMETKSTTAKGKVNELSNAYADLAVQYKNMSNLEKQSGGGKALAASMEQLKVRAMEARTQLAAVNAELTGAAAVKGGLGASLASGVGSALSMYGPQMMAIAGVTAAIAGIKSTVSDVVDINKQFEQSSANLAAVMGTTRNQIGALTQQAKQLGATTQYTAVQILDLQTNLARLGFTNQEILNSTKAVQALATATGADLGEAANLAGAALRGFGMNAAEMDRVASVLAVSTTKSALSFEKLAAGLPTVAPVAKQFGFSIEDTVTLLGKLADAGMDASTAATSTRNILLNLANSGGKLAQALGRPVSSIEELAPALVELKAKGLDLAEMLDLTDKRSVAAFATFVDNAETLTEFKRSITDCSDALDGMVNEQLNTLHGSVTILKSAYEGLLLTFSNGNGILKQTTDALARLLQAWTNWRNRRNGGDAAIGSYENGVTKADRERMDSLYNAYKAGGTTDEQIQAKANEAADALIKERDAAKEVYDQMIALRNATGDVYMKQMPVLNQKAMAMIPGMKAYDTDYMAKYIAGLNDKIGAQNYLAALATTITAPEETTVTGDAESMTAKKLRVKEAEYKEKEMAQIAALNREAMNEEEYEKKVYEIKRTWLQKIADLYEEGTEQRARANASISSLDIQFQASTLRRANQQAKQDAKSQTIVGVGGYTTPNIAALRKEIQDTMNGMQMNSGEYLIQAERLVDLNTFENLLKLATQNGMQLDPAMLENIFERLDRNDITFGLDIDDSEWQKLVKEIEAFTGKKVELNVSTGGVQTATADVGKLSTEWVAAAQAVGQFGSALQSVEDPTAKIAGIIAQAIASVAAGAGSAIAEAGATGDAGGPWGWLAFAISATATMVSTIAAIKSATSGNYAQGGIIPGNSFSGDNLVANVNSGELILNRAQQDAIAGQLTQSPLANLEVTGILEGENIRLALVNNALRRGGSRGEYAITKFG